MCIFAAEFRQENVELCKEKHLYRFCVEFAQITMSEESAILMPFAPVYVTVFGPWHIPSMDKVQRFLFWQVGQNLYT